MPDVHVVPSGNLWACEIDGNIRSTHETRRKPSSRVASWRRIRNSELSHPWQGRQDP